MGYFYVSLTIMFTVYAQLIIKQQLGTISNIPSGLELIPFYIKFILTRPLVMSGFLSVMISSVAWIGALTKFELSYAYQFLSLNFVVIAILSYFLFHDTFNWYKIFGILVVCVGIIITSKGVQ